MELLKNGEPIEQIASKIGYSASYIKKELPLFVTAPPLDDKRPSETSWSYFKKWMEAKKIKK